MIGPPPWLAAAAAAGLALLLRGLAAYRARLDREALGDDSLLDRLAGAPPPAQRLFRSLLLAGGCGALAAGLSLSGETGQPPEESDLQTVLVLDASNSMWAGDLEPSRLERQRAFASQLAVRLPGRLGVVYFAGRGYVLSPLTEDRDAVLMFVRALDPSLVGQGGTSLADGIRQGLDVLAGGDPGGRRALVVLTDGEATTQVDDVRAELKRAARMHVPVFTVGLGTVAGGRIPVSPATREETATSEHRWLTDERGEEVVSRLFEETLKQIARATGATYVMADGAGLERLVRRLAAEVSRPDPSTGRRASVLLIAAFGLLFVEGFLVRRG